MSEEHERNKHPMSTSNKLQNNDTSNKCIATSNKGITTGNKKASKTVPLSSPFSLSPSEELSCLPPGAAGAEEYLTNVWSLLQTTERRVEWMVDLIAAQVDPSSSEFGVRRVGCRGRGRGYAARKHGERCDTEVWSGAVAFGIPGALFFTIPKTWQESSHH